MAKTNSNAKRVILVTGATGKQGGAVLRHLRERGFSVRALTREPNQPKARALVGPGTEVVRGDLDDAASLSRALDGVYGVFSVQNPMESGTAGEIRQGKALASAAQRARVSHFVYSSVVSSDQHTGIPHFDSKAEVEQHLQGLGMQYTVLRPAFFMDNWLGIIRDGTIALPLTPDRKLQQIAVDDIGGIAATVFEHAGHWQGRAVDLAGDDVSMQDVAHILGNAAGHEVRYQQIPWDQFEQHAGYELTIMFHWFQDQGYNVDISQLRSEYPKLTTLDRWARSQKWQHTGGAQHGG